MMQNSLRKSLLLFVIMILSFQIVANEVSSVTVNWSCDVPSGRNIQVPSEQSFTFDSDNIFRQRPIPQDLIKRYENWGKEVPVVKENSLQEQFFRFLGEIKSNNPNQNYDINTCVDNLKSAIHQELVQRGGGSSTIESIFEYVKYKGEFDEILTDTEKLGIEYYSALGQTSKVTPMFYPMDDIQMSSEISNSMKSCMRESCQFCAGSNPIKKSSVRTFALSKNYVENIIPEFSDLSNSCKNNLFKEYMSAILENGNNGDLFQSCLENRNFHSNCASIVQNMNSLMNILNENLGQNDQITEQDRERISNLSACVGESSNSLDFLDEISEILGKKIECVELKDGDVNVVDAENDSVTGVGKSYTLKRKGNTYQAYVNLDIGDNYFADNLMEDKIRGCIDQVSDYLIGPDGKKLEIVLYPDSDNPLKPHEKPPAFEIEYDEELYDVDGNKKRASSNYYIPDMSCSTHVHELMHILGLVDEYHESKHHYNVDKETGSVYSGQAEENSVSLTAFNCRATGPRHSLMSNHEQAYLSLEGANIFESTPELREEHGVPTRSSLLLPGQFNSIINGNCADKNKAYNYCARLAYKTSKDQLNQEDLNMINSDSYIQDQLNRHSRDRLVDQCPQKVNGSIDCNSSSNWLGNDI